jgi:hypothetical protein
MIFVVLGETLCARQIFFVCQPVVYLLLGGIDWDGSEGKLQVVEPIDDHRFGRGIDPKGRDIPRSELVLSLGRVLFDVI